MKDLRPNSHYADDLTGLSDVAMLTYSKSLTFERIEECVKANHLFPTTKRQAEYFINSEYGCLGLLGAKDVERIELLLNKHGMRGRYQYTKSRRFVNFVSGGYLERALQLEYSL